MAGRPNESQTRGTTPTATRPVYPFTAIVAQEEMKLALLLNVIAPAVGGVLVMGHRGTGKSTAVRALAELLPPLTSVRDCAYNCDPQDVDNLCGDCRRRLAAGAKLTKQRSPVPVVELPLGATEDRVCGTIDIERALKEGVKAFEPGLLARANRGFLYIDEVNLLEDHLVDLLLDAAATGANRVEREGVSAEHPARFVLVGSGNPEEGELRPQFLDRFGTSVEVRTIRDPAARVSIVELREAFERDPERFLESSKAELEALRRRLLRAQRTHRNITTPRDIMFSIAELCIRLGVDGHRGELTITRAARALAAFEGRRKVTAEDVRRVAPMCLRHRLRRDPLEMVEGGARIDEALADIFGDDTDDPNESDDGTARQNSSPGKRPDKRRGHDAPDSSQHDSHQTSAHASPPTDHEESADPSRLEDKLIAPQLATVPEDAFDPHRSQPSRNGRARSTARRDTGRKRTSFAARGRYATATADKAPGARVAVDATLRRACAAHSARHESAAQTVRHESASPELRVRASDLLFKRYRQRTGALYIFAVDTSGSMALNRIGHAKGAALHLLRKSYVNRDRVALITFRARAAEVVLAPSNSQARAARVLEALPVGGATPLASALQRALELARHARHAGSVRLLLFTDGRGNVSLTNQARAVVEKAAVRKLIEAEIEQLGRELQAEGVVSLVVDTMMPFASSGEGEFVARALGGRYARLPRTAGWQDCVGVPEA